MLVCNKRLKLVMVVNKDFFTSAPIFYARIQTIVIQFAKIR